MKFKGLVFLALLGNVSTMGFALENIRDEAGRPIIALPDRTDRPAPVKKDLSIQEFTKLVKPTDVVTDELGNKFTGAQLIDQVKKLDAYFKPKNLNLIGASKDFGETSKGDRDDAIRDTQLKELMLGLSSVQFKAGEDLKHIEPALLMAPANLAVAPACTSTKKLDKSGSYSKSFGKRSTAQVSLLIKGAINADCNLARGTAEAGIQGAALNKDLPIVKATMLGETTRTNKHKLDSDFFVFGSKIADLDKTATGAINVSERKEKSYAPKVSGEYPLIGPVLTIPYTFGVRGTVGVTYKFKSGFLSASANVTPQFKLNGFAEGGATFILVSGNVGAELLVIDISNPNTALAEVSVNAQNKWQARAKGYSRLDMKALDGSVYARYSVGRRVCVPFIGCHTFELYSGKETIFSWSGFNVNKTLWSFDELLTLD